LRTAIAGGALEGAATEVRGAAPDTALSQVTLLPPITDPDKIICAGRNYRPHAAEAADPAGLRPLRLCRVQPPRRRFRDGDGPSPVRLVSLCRTRPSTRGPDSPSRCRPQVPQPPSVQPTCNSYTVPLTVGGQPQNAVVEACQQADGSWRVTQTTPGLPPQVYEVPPPAASPYPSPYSYPEAYPYPDFYDWGWGWDGAPWFFGLGPSIVLVQRFNHFHHGFAHAHGFRHGFGRGFGHGFGHGFAGMRGGGMGGGGHR
jgi:hypothetical protein